MAPRRRKPNKDSTKTGRGAGATNSSAARASRVQRPVDVRSDADLLPNPPPGMGEVGPRNATITSEQESALLEGLQSDDDTRLNQLTEYFLRLGAETDPSKPGFDPATNMQPALNALSQLSPSAKQALMDRMLVATGLDPEYIKGMSVQDKLGLMPKSLYRGFAGELLPDAPPDVSQLPPERAQIVTSIYGMGPEAKGRVMDTLLARQGLSEWQISQMPMDAKIGMMPDYLRDVFAANAPPDLSPTLGGMADDGPKIGAPDLAATGRATAPRGVSPADMSVNDVIAALENMSTHGGWAEGRRAVPEGRSTGERVQEWSEQAARNDLTQRQQQALGTQRDQLIRKMSPTLMRRMEAWQDENIFGWDHRTGTGKVEQITDADGNVVGQIHSADKVAQVLFRQDPMSTSADKDVVAATRKKYDDMAQKVKVAATPKAAKEAMNSMLRKLSVDTRASLGSPDFTQMPVSAETQAREERKDAAVMIPTRQRVLDSLSRRAGLVRFAEGGHKMELLPEKRVATEVGAEGDVVGTQRGTYSVANDVDTTAPPLAASEAAVVDASESAARPQSVDGLVDAQHGNVDSATIDLDRIAPWWRSQFPEISAEGDYTYNDRSPSGRLLAGLIARSYEAETPEFAEQITPLIERSILKYQNRKPSTLAARRAAQRQLRPGATTSEKFLQYMQNNAADAPYPLFMDTPADRSWMADLVAEDAKPKRPRNPALDTPYEPDMTDEEFAAAMGMEDLPDVGEAGAGEAGSLPEDEYYYPDDSRDMPPDEYGMDLGPSSNDFGAMSMPMNRMRMNPYGSALAGLVA